jgi:hypothetical protein
MLARHLENYCDDWKACNGCGDRIAYSIFRGFNLEWRNRTPPGSFTSLDIASESPCFDLGA